MGHETVGLIAQLGDGLEHDWTGQPLAISVWVGHFDGAPMREVSGVTGAAPFCTLCSSTCARGLARLGLRSRRSAETWSRWSGGL